MLGSKPEGTKLSLELFLCRSIQKQNDPLFSQPEQVISSWNMRMYSYFIYVLYPITPNIDPSQTFMLLLMLFVLNFCFLGII